MSQPNGSLILIHSWIPENHLNHTLRSPQKPPEATPERRNVSSPVGHPKKQEALSLHLSPVGCSRRFGSSLWEFSGFVRSNE